MQSRTVPLRVRHQIRDDWAVRQLIREIAETQGSDVLKAALGAEKDDAAKLYVIQHSDGGPDRGEQLIAKEMV